MPGEVPSVIPYSQQIHESLIRCDCGGSQTSVYVFISFSFYITSMTGDAKGRLHCWFEETSKEWKCSVWKVDLSCITCPLNWKGSTGRSASLHTGSPYGRAPVYLSSPVSQFPSSAVFCWCCEPPSPEDGQGVCLNTTSLTFVVSVTLFTFQFWKELAWPAHTRAFLKYLCPEPHSQQFPFKWPEVGYGHWSFWELPGVSEEQPGWSNTGIGWHWGVGGTSGMKSRGLGFQAQFSLRCSDHLEVYKESSWSHRWERWNQTQRLLPDKSSIIRIGAVYMHV